MLVSEIEYAESKKPARYMPEQAKELERRLTEEQKRGIILPKSSLVLNMQYFGKNPIGIHLPKKEYGKIIHEINTLYYDFYQDQRVFWHETVIDDSYYVYKVLNKGFDNYVIMLKVKKDD